MSHFISSPILSIPTWPYILYHEKTFPSEGLIWSLMCRELCFIFLQKIVFTLTGSQIYKPGVDLDLQSLLQVVFQLKVWAFKLGGGGSISSCLLLESQTSFVIKSFLSNYALTLHPYYPQMTDWVFMFSGSKAVPPVVFPLTNAVLQLPGTESELKYTMWGREKGGGDE